MDHQRTPLGNFVHTSWTNLNIRCGIYRHLQTVEKCRTYQNVHIEFTREEFKTWCIDHEQEILNLKRPSLDRKDNTKNYTLDNIQVIELALNIRKDKTVFHDGIGVCSTCHKEKQIDKFAKDKRRFSGRSSVCKVCDNARRGKRDKR